MLVTRMASMTVGIVSLWGDTYSRLLDIKRLIDDVSIRVSYNWTGLFGARVQFSWLPELLALGEHRHLKGMVWLTLLPRRHPGRSLCKCIE